MNAYLPSGYSQIRDKDKKKKRGWSFESEWRSLNGSFGEESSELIPIHRRPIPLKRDQLATIRKYRSTSINGIRVPFCRFYLHDSSIIQTLGIAQLARKISNFDRNYPVKKETKKKREKQRNCYLELLLRRNKK